MPVCAAVHVPPAVSPSLGGTLEKAPGCACLIYPAKHNCFCSVSQGHAETLARRSVFVSAVDSKQSCSFNGIGCCWGQSTSCQIGSQGERCIKCQGTVNINVLYYIKYVCINVCACGTNWMNNWTMRWYICLFLFSLFSCVRINSTQ